MQTYTLQILYIQKTNKNIPDRCLIIYKLQKKRHIKQHLVLYKQVWFGRFCCSDYIIKLPVFKNMSKGIMLKTRPTLESGQLFFF